MISKRITVEFQSESTIIELDIGESKLVDLNNDGINDIKITYNELVVNRVDLTITELNNGSDNIDNIRLIQAQIAVLLEKIIELYKELLKIRGGE